MDRLETRTDPLGNVEMYQYGLAGNLKQFTDRRRKVTIFGYDALNRRNFAGFGTIFGPPDTHESTISYGYDGLNRLTQADVAVPLFDTTLLDSQMAVDFILGKQGLAHVRTIQ